MSHPRTRGERRDLIERKIEHKRREYVRITRRNVCGWVRGTLRKGHHWFACGKPRCGRCHGEKLSGKLRPRDVRRLQASI